MSALGCARKSVCVLAFIPSLLLSFPSSSHVRVGSATQYACAPEGACKGMDTYLGVEVGKSGSV